ncbi:MAG: DNA-binding protein [Ignavibacteria bacterium GWF2_33_9]|nr:MAG: DNA-binding protein [Ignavibacteria bacterium GWF2_33_9]
MINLELIKPEDIQSKIMTIRNLQVMLDSDLSTYYGVDTKRLNQQVKRNIERFPKEFCFQLTLEEFELLKLQTETFDLRSQNATSNLKSQSVISNEESLRSQIATSKGKGGRRYLPYVFTEQGVAMLSAVLHSETAVKMSIQIMNAFVAMRHFLISNAQLFHEINSIKLKQADTDQKVDLMFEAFESKLLQPSQGIFFDGQTFDAWNFVSDLVRKAEKSLILIDNFIDDSVFLLFSKRTENVNVTIYTKSISKQLDTDLRRFNSQYAPIEIKQFGKSHDRFLIIDEKEVYLIGASLKDLGKKWFGFSRIDSFLDIILKNLEK